MNTIVQSRAEELATLCRRFHVRRLALFGSALRADFDAGRSDLDFIVEFEPPATGEYADTYFGLLQGLEALFDRPVDLVEAGAVRNPYIQRDINRTQEVIYAT